MRVLRAVSLACAVLLAGLNVVSAQSWTPLTNQPTFSPSAEFLLTDGRVLMQDYSATDWWVLTPDINGSYVNGTWSQVASMPATFNYAPLFYASAVLPDGRLAILGGEYNFGNEAFTNLGAVYNPTTNEWKALVAPRDVTDIRTHIVNPSPGSEGDAASVVLANGDWMVAACCDAFNNDGTNGLDLASGGDLHWKPSGTGKADNYDEEGFTLLPGGKVLLADTTVIQGSEIYDPSTGAWTSAGTIPVAVADPVGDEVGPAVLRYDGTVLQTGATGHNAVYDTNTGTWSAAPDFPLNGQGVQLDVYDGPASILPNGNVLVMTSPGQYKMGAQFFEWDGTNFNSVPATPNAANVSSYFGRMLVLPDGGVMATDYSQDVEIYYTSGGPDESWRPTITSIDAKEIHPGEKGRKLIGTQLTGLSEGAAFGDDFQDSTNYPIVSITNNATGHLFNCRSYNFSSGVATGATPQTTLFDVPAAIETGDSTVVVTTNGIISAGYSIIVKDTK